jgi:hypothetical protein
MNLPVDVDVAAYLCRLYMIRFWTYTSIIFIKRQIAAWTAGAATCFILQDFPNRRQICRQKKEKEEN